MFYPLLIQCIWVILHFFIDYKRDGYLLIYRLYNVVFYLTIKKKKVASIQDKRKVVAHVDKLLGVITANSGYYISQDIN